MEVFKNEGYQFPIQTTESHYEFTQTFFSYFQIFLSKLVV